MILSCFGVLVMDRRTDIGGCRVAFATENGVVSIDFIQDFTQL